MSVEWIIVPSLGAVARSVASAVSKGAMLNWTIFDVSAVGTPGALTGEAVEYFESPIDTKRLAGMILSRKPSALESI